MWCKDHPVHIIVSSSPKDSWVTAWASVVVVGGGIHEANTECSYRTVYLARLERKGKAVKSTGFESQRVLAFSHSFTTFCWDSLGNLLNCPHLSFLICSLEISTPACEGGCEQSAWPSLKGTGYFSDAFAITLSHICLSPCPPADENLLKAGTVSHLSLIHI